MSVEPAVLGTGRVGKMHSKAIGATEVASLVAVTDAEAAEALAGDADVRTMDETESAGHIDAVAACTPNDAHAAPMDRFDLDVATKRCSATVEGAGVPLTRSFQRPHDPGFCTLKAQIDASRVGVEMVALTSRDPGAAQRLRRALGPHLPRHDQLASRRGCRQGPGRGLTVATTWHDGMMAFARTGSGLCFAREGRAIAVAGVLT